MLNHLIKRYKLSFMSMVIFVVDKVNVSLNHINVVQRNYLPNQIKNKRKKIFLLKLKILAAIAKEKGN